MTDVDTLTLAEFLLARIAEDEARVESLTGEWPDEIAVVPRSSTADGCVAVSRPGPKPYARVWLTDVSPDFGWRYHESGVVVWSTEIAKRALAECEAKRKIVGLHETIAEAYMGCTVEAHPCCRICTAGGIFAVRSSFPCETVRLLGAVHADHPDYRDEWKPDA